MVVPKLLDCFYCISKSYKYLVLLTIARLFLLPFFAYQKFSGEKYFRGGTTHDCPEDILFRTNSPEQNISGGTKIVVTDRMFQRNENTSPIVSA